MSQATTWGVPQPADAATERSTELYGQRDQASLNALLSSHSGAARPSYALVGTVWLDTDTGQLKMWDGTNDIPIALKVAVPATAADPGEPGQIAADGSHFYICTATDTWVRAAVATW